VQGLKIQRSNFLKFLLLAGTLLLRPHHVSLLPGRVRALWHHGRAGDTFHPGAQPVVEEPIRGKAGGKGTTERVATSITWSISAPLRVLYFQSMDAEMVLEKNFGFIGWHLIWWLTRFILIGYSGLFADSLSTVFHCGGPVLL
jgi:hypothetical protein